MTSLCRRAVACGLALLTVVGAAAAATLPPPEAIEAAALPGGRGWLVAERRMLRLIDGAGVERDRRPAVRAQHLDTRPHPAGLLAVALDADTQRTLRFVVDTASMSLRPLDALPAPAFPVETLCIGRDGQGLDHVLLVAKDGIAEHWVMPADAAAAQARLLRRLALPPQTKHCRVDDERQILYAAEPDLGLWAYPADAETPPTRWPVVLRKPFGPLERGAAALALLPGGIAVLDSNGRQVLGLRAMTPVGAGKDEKVAMPWRVERTWALASEAVKRSLVVQALAADGRTAARLRLGTHAGTKGPWLPTPVAWPAPQRVEPVQVVQPRMQTALVARFGDAADDPALWRHASDPARSRILGTNKKQGLLVYDMTGREVQLLEVGRLNNVDLRQDVRLGDSMLDIAVATQRDDLDVVLFTIDAEGQVHEAGRIHTGLPDIYGICLHRPPAGGLQVIVNDKDGRHLQYKVSLAADGKLGGTLARRFKVATQPEACVADDARNRLFLGEEKRGVWSLAAGADDPVSLRLILPVGPVLKADVEGLGLYDGDDGRYLVISSQGNSRFIVIDADPPYAVRGQFRIGLNLAEGIDGVSDTDGLEVSSRSFGGPFERGILVVQDGYKRLPDGPQNFKAVAWDDIAKALGIRR